VRGAGAATRRSARPDACDGPPSRAGFVAQTSGIAGSPQRGSGRRRHPRQRGSGRQTPVPTWVGSPPPPCGHRPPPQRGSGRPANVGRVATPVPTWVGSPPTWVGSPRTWVGSPPPPTWVGSPPPPAANVGRVATTANVGRVAGHRQRGSGRLLSALDRRRNRAQTEVCAPETNGQAPRQSAWTPRHERHLWQRRPRERTCSSRPNVGDVEGRWRATPPETLA